jgi:L-ascorbate metabolism protein UlaG (beta-lactamase superfamily)
MNLFIKFPGFLFLTLAIFACQGQPAEIPKMDEFTYDKNNVKIYFFGHATLRLDFNGTIIHVDPVTAYAKYEEQPKADVILITHEHGDHLDANAIAKITKEGTALLVPQSVFDILKKGVVIANGQVWEGNAVKVEAVPAYNTTQDRDKFHPKGRGNGYILTLGDKRIYIAGDTEDIPEMANLKNIDIAFLPMNQPYTMTPEQVVNAVKMFQPKILYPYHFGNTDVSKLQDLFKDIKDVELRIRELK